jgi:hypothetical protein
MKRGFSEEHEGRWAVGKHVGRGAGLAWMWRHVAFGAAVLVLLMLAVGTGRAQSIVLQAPATVTAGAPFSVTWSGSGDPKDFLTVVPVGSRDGDYGAYGYARAATVELVAPEEPGEYEVRYLGASSPYPTLARAPITVLAASATIEVLSSVESGAEFSVKWTGPNHATDFITIVPAGSPERHYTEYVYTKKGSPLNLRAPDTGGSYEVRYLTGGEYRTLASAPIEVGASSASLQISGAVSAGQEFEVAWIGPDNPQDWIGIFTTGAAANGYSMYRYTSKGSPLTLRAPDDPGAYEVRYMTGQSNSVLAMAPLQVDPVSASLDAPAQVKAGEVISITWTGPGHRGDFVSVAVPGAAERPHVDFTYTHRGNPAEMAAPLEPGEYELRYQTGQSSRVLARAPIRITPSESEPGTLLVLAAAGPDAIAFGPDDAVELILDASGSMLQKQGERRRIDIAKDALTLLAESTIPSGTPFAMRVFGHREKDSCRTDLEISLRPLDPAVAASQVRAIEAMNLAKTPIARSLELVSEDLASVTGERIVVLITDGEETCGGDPGAVIQALRQSGTEVRVNIVGFAIDDADLAASFRYWADLGGGGYHDAKSADALAASLRSALRTPFEVVDAQGRIVSLGIVGGAAISLPAGIYTVRAGEFESSVTIRSNEEARVTASR